MEHVLSAQTLDGLQGHKNEEGTAPALREFTVGRKTETPEPEEDRELRNHGNSD